MNNKVQVGREGQASSRDVGGRGVAYRPLYPENGYCAHSLGNRLAHITDCSGKARTDHQPDSTLEATGREPGKCSVIR